MKNYIRYEIESRKYSSNCVIGVYIQHNKETGKQEEVKDKLLAPFLPKKEGDELTQIIIDNLSNKLMI